MNKEYKRRITVEEALKSLNTWHSEKLNGGIFYESKAVKIALQKVNNENDNKAWCPICFDELRCIKIYDESDLIKKYKYKCFGCDKEFTLK